MRGFEPNFQMFRESAALCFSRVFFFSLFFFFVFVFFLLGRGCVRPKHFAWMSLVRREMQEGGEGKKSQGSLGYGVIGIIMAKVLFFFLVYQVSSFR